MPLYTNLFSLLINGKPGKRYLGCCRRKLCPPRKCVLSDRIYGQIVRVHFKPNFIIKGTDHELHNTNLYVLAIVIPTSKAIAFLLSRVGE